jgi:hypothetical protein
MTRALLVLLFGLSILAPACGGADPSADAAADDLKSGPACHATAQCVEDFDKGTWVVSKRTVDTCIQNHDFADLCISCGKRHTCEFHAGF